MSPGVQRALEVCALTLGLAYAVLAVRRNRYCWVSGGLSSAILVGLAAQAQLPMQAGLNLYYVVMSVYGWWRWTAEGAEAQRIGTWPLWAHALGLAAVFAAAAATAQLLAADTRAAHPFLDSVTTWASLLTTWLVAQVKLESWLYWIAIDLALAGLFASQGLYITALLFVIYLGISAVGFASWLRQYRAAQAQPA